MLLFTLEITVTMKIIFIIEIVLITAFAHRLFYFPLYPIQTAFYRKPYIGLYWICRFTKQAYIGHYTGVFEETYIGPYTCRRTQLNNKNLNISEYDNVILILIMHTRSIIIFGLIVHYNNNNKCYTDKIIHHITLYDTIQTKIINQIIKLIN